MTSVMDTGIGIKTEDIDKLFKFFGKVESSQRINQGGMGFGLTISKMILSQMHGSISVESTYGQGSTFTFGFLVTNYKFNDNDDEP